MAGREAVGKAVDGLTTRAAPGRSTERAVPLGVLNTEGEVQIGERVGTAACERATDHQPDHLGQLHPRLHRPDASIDDSADSIRRLHIRTESSGLGGTSPRGEGHTLYLLQPTRTRRAPPQLSGTLHPRHDKPGRSSHTTIGEHVIAA
jgi:hypothetical protein